MPNRLCNWWCTFVSLLLCIGIFTKIKIGLQEFEPNEVLYYVSSRLLEHLRMNHNLK